MTNFFQTFQTPTERPKRDLPEKKEEFIEMYNNEYSKKNISSTDFVIYKQSEK